MEHNRKRDKLFPAAAGLILSELVLSGELKAGFLDGSYPGGVQDSSAPALGNNGYDPLGLLQEDVGAVCSENQILTGHYLHILCFA